MSTITDVIADDRRFTVSVSPLAASFLKEEAAKHGLGLAEYASIILEKKAMEPLDRMLAPTRAWLQARHRIKMEAAKISRRIAETEGVQPDHTLRVFREIREQHLDDYLVASQTKAVPESGSAHKHALNLALGAISKHAAGARVKLGPDGKRVLIRNIRGELCTTVTALEPGEDTEED
jgi:hypothetical protein